MKIRQHNIKIPDSKQLIISALFIWLLIGIFYHHHIGLADNGDFTRSMQWFTDKPVGISANWPPTGSDEYKERFYNYWLPHWELKWNLSWPTTSAQLLWLPGVLVNTLFFSRDVLYIEWLSFLPRLFLIAILLLLYQHVKIQNRHTNTLLIGLGIPITLLLTSSDYIAYFNSFYQESAAFTFLFLTLASILYLRRRPSRRRLIFCLISILLLASSKSSHIYWPLISVPFVFMIWHSGNKTVSFRKSLWMAIATALALTAASIGITRSGSLEENPYHSLFYGVLTFSDHPSQHLQQLGMEDASPCIDHSAYTLVGRDCLNRYTHSYWNTFRVAYREPVVIFRTIRYSLNQMQDISLDYLGKYTFNDPRSRTFTSIPELGEQRWLPDKFTLWNLWSFLKYYCFPTGWILVLLMVMMTFWFTVILIKNRTSIQKDFAIIGLLTIIASITHSQVSIWGEGKYELIKHLFMSNLTFDMAIIIYMNSVVLFFLNFLGKSFNAPVQTQKAV